MTYVDGIVAAVPNHRKQAFLEHARRTAALLKRCGAQQIVENWGDDVPDGTLTSFPMAVQCAADETVVLSWIIWPSKAVRDAGMKEFVADPAMDPEANPVPFDGKRMIFGGFETILSV